MRVPGLMQRLRQVAVSAFEGKQRRVRASGPKQAAFNKAGRLRTVLHWNVGISAPLSPIVLCCFSIVISEVEEMTKRPLIAPRNTRQKEAIRSAFLKAGRPLSPMEALEQAGEAAPGLSIATVYRNITAMVEEGSLVAVDLPGLPARYETAGKSHHHHFQCRVCQKVFEFAGCSLPKPKLPRGFRVTGHEFFLYGTCATCH